MDTDFLITYETMYDNRSYRSESDYEREQEDEDIDEVIPPWEMEW
jgi:hypothetical protein